MVPGLRRELTGALLSGFGIVESQSFSGYGVEADGSIFGCGTQMSNRNRIWVRNINNHSLVADAGSERNDGLFACSNFAPRTRAVFSYNRGLHPTRIIKFNAGPWTGAGFGNAPFSVRKHGEDFSSLKLNL